MDFGRAVSRLRKNWALGEGSLNFISGVKGFVCARRGGIVQSEKQNTEGLSTARRTMMPSGASVEMTLSGALVVAMTFYRVRG